MALPAIIEAEDEGGELAGAGAGADGRALSLTDRQRAFVSAYVECGANGSEAARRAGYADAKGSAYGLLRTPHVLAAIKAEQRRYLNADLTTLALETVRGILSDPDAPKGVKASLALGVLDRGGLPAVRAAEAPKEHKSLEEMSIAELDAFIREKEAKLTTAGSSTPTAPEFAPKRSQVIEGRATSSPIVGEVMPPRPAASSPADPT